MDKPFPAELPDRREFITNALMTAGALAMGSAPFAGITGPYSRARKEYTVQEVIDIIIKEIPGSPFSQTVDTIKSGNSENKVSGIVTTMFATIDVIHATITNGADFIIAHEPTFYNHADKLNFVPDNEIVKEKQRLLELHNITIWRFHDYWHAHKPDGITYGVLRMAGWVSYYQPGNPLINIPEITLKDLL